jgi:hypothetical protein
MRTSPLERPVAPAPMKFFSSSREDFDPALRQVERQAGPMHSRANDDDVCDVGHKLLDSGNNGIDSPRLFQGSGDCSRFSSPDQRDHVPPAPPARQLGAQRAGLAGCIDKVVEFRGRNAHAAQHGVVLVHQWAETFGHAVFDQLAGGPGDAADRRKKRLVAVRFFVVLHAHIADGFFGRGGMPVSPITMMNGFLTCRISIGWPLTK